MVIMPKRYDSILETLAGLQRTGMPLIAAQGDALGGATVNDDPGIYYFVPLIAHHFDLPLDTAITVFLGGILGLGLLLGLVGSFLLLRTRMGRLAGTFQLALVGTIAFLTGDVYVASVAAAFGIVPLFLYLASRERFGAGLGPFLFFAGVGSAMAQTVRTHAGTPVWLLIGTWILFVMPGTFRRKLALAASLAAGIFLWQAYFNHQLDRRDAFLEQHQPGFMPQHRVHIFWSPIYEGLGFLGNNFGLVWNDEVAGAHVEAIAPGIRFTSPEYEAVVRSEVLRLAREHPYFMARTIFGKLGVMFMFLLVSAHIGLLAALMYPKPRIQEAAFWLPLAVAGLPGVLVMPWHGYVAGFLALAAIYGALSIDHAAQQGTHRWIVRIFRSPASPGAMPHA